MATLEQKIHDATYRIGRLARYCDRLAELKPTGPMSSLECKAPAGAPAVFKYKGTFYLVPPGGRVLVCDPRTSEVRFWFEMQGDVLTPEEAMKDLVSFEESLTAVAMERARHEAIEEMARRTIRRVTTPKTRGFKADQKRKKPKTAPSEG